VESKLKVKILRKAKVSMYPFMDYFKGFEKLETVKRIFGEKTEEVLRNLKVEFAGMRAYMGVSDKDGHLLISANYLNNGDMTDLYLDVIHELVHVRQFMEGKQLFDSDFSYIERPTEVEAYQVAVEEARRLGLDDERICEYLRTEWMSDEDFKRLSEAMGVKCSSDEEKKTGARPRS
jgi:predicted HAD superfamily Cof-like phosphohydrolase